MAPDDFKAWRKRLGLTQQEAADRLGISRGSVENYERGRRREDHRPVEVPLYIEQACNWLALSAAAETGTLDALSKDQQERMRRLAEMARTRFGQE